MTDLIIVGGGPVGLGAALRAERAGLDVTVVERRTGVIDKACGEGLMATGRELLRELGIDPPGREFTGITYTSADGTTAVRAPLPRPGLGVRRTTLHRELRSAVDARGIRVETGTLIGLSQDAHGVSATVRGRHGERMFRSQHLLGADGLHSTVRRLSGLAGRASSLRRHGIRQHFLVPPWSADVEVHWGPAGEAYVTPVSESEVGIAILTTRRLPHQDLLATFPALGSRLTGASASSAARGAGPLWQRSTRRTTGRIMLAGDASGYVDALTGEGLTLGLAQARAAIDCVIGGRITAYESMWRRVTLPRATATAVLVTATRPGRTHQWVPSLMRSARPAFAGVVSLLN